MRRTIKKLLAFTSAAVMACGVCSLAACGTSFTTPDGMPSGAVTSNGGFVVSIGDEDNGYYYFINGKETYTSNNNYGVPVKGALMRAKKSDVAQGKGDAEIVVPSLMVTGSYNGGIYIYGDRVYYATPTNVKDIEGQVQNAYLDFVSAKLDGTDRKELVRVSSNSTDYRFVCEGDTVYLVYYDSSNQALHSFNTKEEKDVVLAKGISGDGPVFHKTDKENVVIYYTMAVPVHADTDQAHDNAFYNQIYRVTAGTTEAPYEYEWDEEWLKDHDGEAPYVNLGTLVLDGRGTKEEAGKFNHSTTDPVPPYGYTYTLRSYENGGLYLLRKEKPSLTGEDKEGELFYLGEDELTATSWDSVGGNESLSVIASEETASKTASADALYYIDTNGNHHYIYVKDDGIFRADVADGAVTNTLKIAVNATGAKLVALDPIEEGDAYGYVYYTLTTSGNDAIYRAVYDNEAHNVEQHFYSNLDDGSDNKNLYGARRILDLVHATGWYNFEIIGTDLFFADADTTAGSALNYISRVSLATPEGKLMNNAQLKAFDEKLNLILGYDTENLSKNSLLSDISEEMEEDVLSNAVKYYFYAGERTLLDENNREYEDAIKENEEKGGDEEITNPYTDILEAFDKFVKGEELTYNGNTYTLKEEGGKLLNTRSAFITRLGKMNDADKETLDNYWQTTVLDKYTPPATEEAHGLAGWKIALIVVACIIAAAAVAAGVSVYLVKKHKKENAPAKVRMHVDTTDDKDIDVYADDDAVRPENELTEGVEAPEAQAEEESGEPAEGEDPADPYNE